MGKYLPKIEIILIYFLIFNFVYYFYTYVNDIALIYKFEKNIVNH